MRRIPVCIFTLLGAGTLIFYLIGIEYDSARSVVPGWHTEAYAPSFIKGIFSGIVLMLVAFFYWLMFRKGLMINPVLYLLHIGATVPALIHQYFPGIIFNIEFSDSDAVGQALGIRTDLVTAIWILFASAQSWFVLYFLRRYIGRKRDLQNSSA